MEVGLPVGDAAPVEEVDRSAGRGKRGFETMVGKIIPRQI